MISLKNTSCRFAWDCYLHWFNLAAPFYRVRSVNSHRLGDILRNGISLLSMAW